MKVNGSYDWLVYNAVNSDGCSSRYFHSHKLYDIINNNRFNLNTADKYSCSTCKTFNAILGSYIALVDEDKFLNDPDYYIENAYDKSKNIGQYDLTKCK